MSDVKFRVFDLLDWSSVHLPESVLHMAGRTSPTCPHASRGSLRPARVDEVLLTEALGKF